MKRVILALATVLTIGANSAFATGGSGITPDFHATQQGQRHAEPAPIAKSPTMITMTGVGSVQTCMEQPSSARMADPTQTFLNYQRFNPLMGGGGG